MVWRTVGGDIFPAAPLSPMTGLVAFCAIHFRNRLCKVMVYIKRGREKEAFLYTVLNSLMILKCKPLVFSPVYLKKLEIHIHLKSRFLYWFLH